MASRLESRESCSVCKSIEKRVTQQGRLLLIPDDILDETVGDRKPASKDEKQRNLDNFFRPMNALINEGGGMLYLHTEKPHLLNFFDEQVDEKLTKLIPDGSPYRENFNRLWYDSKHLIFEVYGKERRLSTLTFNTKSPLDTGLTDPGQKEMRNLVSDPQPKGGTTIGNLDPLQKGAEVKIGGFTFQESVNVQAKSVRVDHRSQQAWTQQLADYCWENVSLPHYISAFSKLESGGSIYYGLSEEKVPDRGKEKKTGRFLCQGLQLSEVERSEIGKEFTKRAASKMLWLAHSDPQNPIQVHFHAVAPSDIGGDKNECVMEVSVAALRGVSFFNKEGPLAFKLKRGQPEKIPIKKWVSLNGGTIEAKSPVFT